MGQHQLGGGPRWGSRWGSLHLKVVSWVQVLPAGGPRRAHLRVPGKAATPRRPLQPGPGAFIPTSPRADQVTNPHPLMHQVLSGPTLSQQDKNHRLQIPTWIKQAWPQKPVEKFKTLSSKIQTGGPPGRRTSGAIWDQGCFWKPTPGVGTGRGPTSRLLTSELCTLAGS